MIYRLLIALFFLTISRILIYPFNTSFFPDLGFGEFLYLTLAGLHFDLFTLASLNLGYIVLLSLPWKFKYHKAYIIFSDFVYFTVNIIGVWMNFSDIVYYRFTRKRTTYDIFDFLDKNGEEVTSLIPSFIQDFWFPFLIWILVNIIFVYIALRFRMDRSRFTSFGLKRSLGGIPVFVIIMGLTVVSIRGGVQYRPINLINASKYTEPKYFPIVLNTPFTLLKTMNESAIEEIDYFDTEEELESIFNPVKIGKSEHKSHKDYNVVVLILESFSAEHSAYLNRYRIESGDPGFTPFLDSLMQKSLVFNGFANGQRSIDGVPAILSSLPSLMETPYLSSPYVGNDLESIASLLKKEGYSTAFFHGGKNGTMGFEAYTRVVGFDKYHGMDEYANDDDFDGNWGIFDEPFLQYTADVATAMEQPFCIAAFTLSSHHPYTIPENYNGKFRKGNLDIHESIMYSDFALSQFFKKIKKETWFENTLFVLTADHCSQGDHPYFTSRLGQYSIPIVFYNPNENWDSLSPAIAQQTDILPSVMDYLGIEQEYISFGESVFDSLLNPFAVMYQSNTYQLVVDSLIYQFDGTDDVALYNYKADSLLKRNLLETESLNAGELRSLMEAIIQQYNNRIIQNKLTIKQD